MLWWKYDILCLAMFYITSNCCEMCDFLMEHNWRNISSVDRPLKVLRIENHVL